ncbi:MAG TPA: hypothetical protein VLK25_11470 [Allosphingosinicella sp.]|nr:hypothetical protein [Allosphingosinicella sp.]
MAKAKAKPPLLEWIAAALGLVLTLGVMAVIARDAFNGSAAMTPDIAVSVLRVRPVSAGYVVEFEAANRAPVTAAQVTVEGALPGGETSTATIDYIPGRSQRRGGLFFATEPRGLTVRALGYQDP